MTFKLSVLMGLSLLLEVQVLPSYSYPQSAMNSCIANGMKNVVDKQLRATLSDVNKYCSCAISKIIDQAKPIAVSIDYCNRVYILINNLLFRSCPAIWVSIPPSKRQLLHHLESVDR